jgi:hypothetical protein
MNATTRQSARRAAAQFIHAVQRTPRKRGVADFYRSPE